MATLAEPRKATQRMITHSSLPQRRWKRYSSWTFYLFIAPWLIGFLMLTLIPLLYAFVVSLTNFSGISPYWHWVGFANYVQLARDPDTWYSLSRTLLLMVVVVPLSIAAGLGLAILVNERVKAVGIFRTIFYVPSIVPIVAASIMWKLIFDRDLGAINALLEWLHLSAITWLIDPTAFYALIVLLLWGVGGGMVIFLAGLQGIPTELQEAARIDGANGWQMFVRVTLPLLSPVLFFQVITGIIASLQIFVQPMLLSESGGVSGVASVPRSNFLYVVNVYQQFLVFNRFGYGSAMLWVLFLVILVITILMFRSSGFWVYYEVERDK